MREGQRIALDVGAVRIGVARCDRLGLLAVPLDAVPAGPQSVPAVVRLVDEFETIEVVCGFPISMNGTVGQAAAHVLEWVRDLAVQISTPIRLVDERLTTVQAQRQLHAAGKTTRSSRGVIDSASAVVMLQAALDAEKSHGSAPGRILRREEL